VPVLEQQQRLAAQVVDLDALVVGERIKAGTASVNGSS
jgi:hypothetical protein